MTSLSQKNLMKLAQEDEHKGDLPAAIQNLEEALRGEHSIDVILQLCDLYLANQEEDQAYALIKEEPDLFSDHRVFQEYCKILQKNNFLIETLQLENLTGKPLPVKVHPASEETQQKIMQGFKQKVHVNESDYEKLRKLNLINFKAFAQSLLLDQMTPFAVRLSLCEDLVRLGLSDTFKIWIAGKLTKFVPAQTQLLEQEPQYQEVIAALGSRFSHNPSQLPLMISEANVVLGSLYPQLKNYVTDPDSFASDLVSYLVKKDGHSHQEIFTKVYRFLK